MLPTDSNLNNLATFEVSHLKGNPLRNETQWTTSGAEMNELQQMNFGKTFLDPLNLPQGLFLLCQGRVRCFGHSVVWSSGFGPFTSLHQCICFQMGTRQALDVPCWGPLKPETLEVDVCMCPVCFQKTFQIKDSKCGVLHQDILDTASSAGYIPAPDALALDRPPPPLPCKAPVASCRPGSRPPWAGQQPLLTPAIKLKSYSLIPQLWSVQSIV